MQLLQESLKLLGGGGVDVSGIIQHVALAIILISRDQLLSFVTVT